MAWAVDFLSWRIGCKKQSKQVDQPRLHPPPLTHSQTLRWTSPGFTTARHQRRSSCSFPCQPWCLPPLLWLMNKGGHTQGGLDFLLLCLDVLCMCPTPVTTLCGPPPLAWPPPLGSPASPCSGRCSQRSPSTVSGMQGFRDPIL